MEVVGFGQPVIGDQLEGGLQGGTQQVKVVDLGREVAQSHAEDGVVTRRQHRGRLTEQSFAGGVVVDEDFHRVDSDG